MIGANVYGAPCKLACQFQKGFQIQPVRSSPFSRDIAVGTYSREARGRAIGSFIFSGRRRLLGTSEIKKLTIPSPITDVRK